MELFLSNVIHHFSTEISCDVKCFIHEMEERRNGEKLLHESLFVPYVNNLNIMSKCYHLTLMDYVCLLAS